jgi:hypothetical protein
MGNAMTAEGMLYDVSAWTFIGVAGSDRYHRCRMRERGN